MKIDLTIGKFVSFSGRNHYGGSTPVSNILNRSVTHKVLLSFVFSAFVGVLSSQQVITNTQGERVVIYPDGSWRLYEEGDSVLLNTSLRKNEPILMDPSGEDRSLINEGSPEDLSDVLLLASQFADQTAREARQANLVLSNEIDKKFQLEAQLREARENDNLIDADRAAQLEQDYKNQESLVGIAKKHQKQTSQFAEKASEILGLPVEKQSRKLAKLMVEHETYFNSDAVPNIPEDVSVQHSVVRYPAGKETTDANVAVGAGSIASERGTMLEHEAGDYHRYERPCNLVQSANTGDKNRIQLMMEKQQIFTHTDPDLRTYFRDKELITCNAFVSRIGENLYLTVNFSIASPNARKNFGGLADGSLLRLLLLDGTIVDLFNLQGDGGKIDPYTGNTIFIGRYLLEKEAQHESLKSELDKMRVVWRTGYEDYQIYNVDFLMNQINCLNSYQ